MHDTLLFVISARRYKHPVSQFPPDAFLCSDVAAVFQGSYTWYLVILWSTGLTLRAGRPYSLHGRCILRTNQELNSDTTVMLNPNHPPLRVEKLAAGGIVSATRAEVVYTLNSRAQPSCSCWSSGGIFVESPKIVVSAFLQVDFPKRPC